ncbi:MAG: hypothetical protein QXF26_04295, partial [Candidatus Bathyarchaeia archaeon]
LPFERGGLDGQALYLNLCNYHQAKTLLNPDILSQLAKGLGIDPAVAFENVQSASIFNEAQQLTVAREISEFLSRNRRIRLVVVHNLTRFVESSRRLGNARLALKQAVGLLKQSAAMYGLAFVATCSSLRKSKIRIPKPEGGAFLRHEANIVVYFRRIDVDAVQAVRAILVKHPYKPSPQAATICMRKGGVDLMGRITPSFRQLYQRQLEMLRRPGGFRDTLLDPEHRRALDQLVKEAWSMENAALSNSGIACLLDILNLMANIHNKKCNNTLMNEIERLKQRLDELSKEIHKESSRQLSEGEACGT